LKGFEVVNEDKMGSVAKPSYRANGDMLSQGGDMRPKPKRDGTDLNAHDLEARDKRTNEMRGEIREVAPDIAEPGLGAQWRRVRARLLAELGEATFNSWFKQISLIGLGDGRVILAVPTRFIRNWLQSHYIERLAELWTEEDPLINRVEILVQAQVSQGVQNAAAKSASAFASPRRMAVPADAPRSLATGNMAGASSAAVVQKAATTFSPRDLGAREVPQRDTTQRDTQMRDGHAQGLESDNVSAPLDPRYTFDNFIIGKSNELAHAAARRVAEATDVTFNPLFLYGGVGLGKTHLMHAIAWEIRRRQPERKVLYLSAEKFMYQFVRALRFKDTMAFKQQFRTVDVLMIDDVQFISGKDSTQEEFFHTFNALIDHNRQVIISADRSPSDLEGIEERIRSRLGWGLAADIHPTDYELRLGILQAKSEELLRSSHIQMPAGVLEFLAHRIVSNVRELEGALKRVVAYASLVGRPITLDMSQDVLRDLLRCNDRKVTIEEIQRRVAEYYNVRLADMLSARRARAVARPRQVAMWLSKQLTTRSLPEIGRKFGGRDHTTVIHAVRKIDELRQSDSGMDEDVDLLKRMLESGSSSL
jgi:chromosomal replication initiator protein